MCIDKIGKSGYKAIVGIDDLSQGPQLRNNIINPRHMREGYGSRVCVCVCMYMSVTALAAIYLVY